MTTKVHGEKKVNMQNFLCTFCTWLDTLTKRVEPVSHFFSRIYIEMKKVSFFIIDIFISESRHLYDIDWEDSMDVCCHAKIRSFFKMHFEVTFFLFKHNDLVV